MSIDFKTAAAYIRVSTDNQTELSPDSQIKVIRQYAKQHGLIVPNEFIFRDDGISGRHAEKRPEFVRMIATAKQSPSPFSAVLLWKFSRFARNQEESIFYKSMLRKNGVDVISVSEPVIDGPFGSLIERIIEWTDEYYSIRLSGEVKRGMTEKVERGGAVSIPAFGYDIVDKKYIINPEQAPLVQKIFSDFISGKPSLQIAKEMNALGLRTNRGNTWENRTVDYILQNPVYIGKIRWNPERKTRRDYDDPDIMITDGIHEPIIDIQVFETVSKMFEDRKKKYHRYARSETKHEYMLHGLVKCSSCGSSLSLNFKNMGLQCVKYMHGKCKESHYISLGKLNESVLTGIETALKSMTFDIEYKNTGSASPQIDVDEIIKRDRQKLKRVKEAYEDGVYSLEEFKETKSLIEQHIESLRTARNASESNKKTSREEFVVRNLNVLETLRNPSISEREKNELLKTFIDRIVFDRKSGEIRIIFYI